MIAETYEHNSLQINFLIKKNHITNYRAYHYSRNILKAGYPFITQLTIVTHITARVNVHEKLDFRVHHVCKFSLIFKPYESNSKSVTIQISSQERAIR